MGETGKEAEKRMEDEKIIALFFARSEQAIQELDKKYGQRCHTVSYNILNNRQDAEECVNDAYFGAWKAMPPAKPNPLLTYLLKIVRNLSLKRYVAAPNAVEDVIEARERAHILEGFLDTLTKENRVIFLRRYWFSDSYQDIAELVGLSEKTVSVRLTRMRQKMRQYLLESGVIL